jgi:hypothetical protein
MTTITTIIINLKQYFSATFACLTYFPAYLTDFLLLLLNSNQSLSINDYPDLKALKIKSAIYSCIREPAKEPKVSE